MNKRQRKKSLKRFMERGGKIFEYQYEINRIAAEIHRNMKLMGQSKIYIPNSNPITPEIGRVWPLTPEQRENTDMS